MWPRVYACENRQPVRVIAVRSIDRHGRQLPLFEGGDWTVQVFLTNRVEDANDLARDYDGRAGIEPHIGELKGSWGIVATTHPELSGWRTAWQRRALLRVPGRLSRSGRRRRLHLPAGCPLLTPLLE